MFAIEGRRFWLTLLGLGFVCRAVVVALSIGTNDMVIWENFGRFIAERGLFELYRTVPAFNHPPLMGLWAQACYELATELGWRVSILFKVPMVLADGLVAGILWSVASTSEDPQRGLRLAALYSLCPASIAVSAYHGNTDCLLAMLCLASAVCLLRGRWGVAGLVLGAAINVKLVPIVLIFPFACCCTSWRGVARFTAGLAVMSLPFVPVLLFAGEGFLAHAFQYNSLPGRWGLSLLYMESATFAPQFAHWFERLYIPNARWLILASAVWFGLQQWRHRSRSPVAVGALTFAAFLVLAPGFGVQYVVWVLPLLLAAQPPVGISYGYLAGAFVTLVYTGFSAGMSPWLSLFPNGRYPVLATCFGLLAWLVLAAYCLRNVAPSARSVQAG